MLRGRNNRNGGRGMRVRCVEAELSGDRTQTGAAHGIPGGAPVGERGLQVLRALLAEGRFDVESGFE